MQLRDIYKVAEEAGIGEEYVIPYGKNKAKVDLGILDSLGERKGKLVLVTAITPTKAGEGKTTASIALAEGLGQMGKKAILCLREPSLGPVFGLKGGATGGGRVTVEPSMDINLHFNGDMHALTSSIDLIAAVIDNSIYQGNPLNIDPERIVWKRALDVNDRALRSITVAEDDKKCEPHKASFVITVASELMAIFCLASGPEDFLKRLKKITVAFDKEGKPITVADLKVSHAVMRLMKDAFNPNLVQTSEGNPVLIHGGPFANIAHGCNSLIATDLALRLSPLVITEAGFGADLGAEKFLDIVCQEGAIKPDMAVLVATIRALKMHGGVAFDDLSTPNVEALERGMANLDKHYSNLASFGLPIVVAINHFQADSEEEIKALESHCEAKGYSYAFLDGYLRGGAGAVDLAKKVIYTLENSYSSYAPLYRKESPLEEKIESICKNIYGADGVVYTAIAKEKLSLCANLGLSSAYVCMAKTPNSLSDDAKKLGVPKGFKINVRDVDFASGANFVIPLCGTIFTMPGLPKVPAAVKMEDEPWK